MVTALVIAGVLMLVAGWPFLRDGDPLNQELVRFHAQQLREAKRLRPEASPVVVLGTSLVKYAILPDEEFAGMTDEAGRRPAHLVRLVSPSGLEPLDDQVLAAFADLAPPVLLVQEQVLFFADPRQGYVGFSRFAKNRLVDLVRSDGRRSFSQEVLDFSQDSAEIPREVGAREMAMVRADRIRQKAGSPRADVLRMIESCRNSGGRVYVLTMPISPRWQAALNVDRTAVQRHIDRLVEAGLVGQLECPIEFAPGDYFDLWHLSREASGRYTRWLLGELAQRSQR